MQKQLNVAMRKISTPALKAGIFNNTKAGSSSRICWEWPRLNIYELNQRKTRTLEEKKLKSEIAALVRQQGVPTFFLTLSCAHLRLIEIIQKLSKVDQADVDMPNLSYHERCSILNNNLVTVVTHFQCRVEVFFKLIVIDGPVGKWKCYAIRH